MNYVFVKLITGEQLMATLKNETDTHIDISHPMIIRLVPVAQEGRIGEHVTATPFCHFAESRDFTLPKSSIIFTKGLSKEVIPHYLNVVRQHDDTRFVPKTKHKVDWAGEEEEMTLEEINKRIDMLESILAGDAADVEEEEKVYIEGNDTLH
jgi:hypothetical protein